MGNLGYMYDEGHGVGRDYGEAVRWYRQAAERGLASAMNNLGTMYHNGTGVRRNRALATTWYRRALDTAPGYELPRNNLRLLCRGGYRTACN